MRSRTEDVESVEEAHGRQLSKSSRTRHLALALAVLVIAFHAALFAGWIIDDAYVSFRYAKNLVRGEGLVFNPGERVEGYTNFSWVLLSVAATALGLPPEYIMPAIGFASAVGLVLLVARAARHLAVSEGRPHPLSGIPAAFAMSCSTGLALYAVCGLEMAFFALLETAAVVALVSHRARRFAWLAGLAFLTRPEAGLIGVVGIALFGARAWRGTREERRDFFEAGSILALLVGPYLGFKLVYFGALLPNTWSAKPPDLAAGFEYVLRGLAPAAGIVVAALGSARKVERSRSDGVVPEDATLRWSTTKRYLALWTVLVLAVALEGGDFMPAGRMLLPSFALLAIAADRGILSSFEKPKSPRELPRILVAIAVLAYPVFTWIDTRFVAHQASLLAKADVGRRNVARELERNGVRSIGTFDVGLLGYIAADARILDLGGLTDPAIAKSPGYYWNKQPSLETLREKAPDAFVFTTLLPAIVDPGSGSVSIPSHYATEGFVQELSWFSQNYDYVGTATVLEENYYLHWFARKGGPGT